MEGLRVKPGCLGLRSESRLCPGESDDMEGGNLFTVKQKLLQGLGGDHTDMAMKRFPKWRGAKVELSASSALF